MLSKILDVSTSHVSRDDFNLLENNKETNNDFPIRIISHNYGVMIHVQHEPFDPASNDKLYTELENIGLSKQFSVLYRYAISKDCQWINLDQDGESIEDLLTFKW